MVLDKYSGVNEIRSKFYNDPSASVDPILNYKRDPFFFQNLQLLADFSPTTIKAFYSPKPHAFDILKMNVSDMLDEEEGIE